MRLEYWMSFWRLKTSAIVSGSVPVEFHMCTAKITESFRGLSSKTASVGVFDKMPPSQYSSFSIRTGGKGRRQRARGHDVLNAEFEIDFLTA